jgi:hypothetical protein
VTLWDDRAALDLFKVSDAMRALSAQAVGLTIPPHSETLFDVVDD